MKKNNKVRKAKSPQIQSLSDITSVKCQKYLAMKYVYILIYYMCTMIISHFLCQVSQRYGVTTNLSEQQKPPSPQKNPLEATFKKLALRGFNDDMYPTQEHLLACSHQTTSNL